eukprot:jgi/Bigna1/88130/estExt_fgenesh1_pg.C_280138
MGNTLKRTGMFYGAIGVGYGSYHIYETKDSRDYLISKIKPFWLKLPLVGTDQEEKQKDLSSLRMLEVVELWPDCGQLFRSYPPSIDSWHGIATHKYNGETIKTSAEDVGIPAGLLQISVDAEPLKAVAGTFSDESVDAMVVSKHLNEIDDCESLFKEALRVLKPGGQLVCWKASKVHCFYTCGMKNSVKMKSELTQGTSKCSLEAKEIEDMGFFEVEERNHDGSSLTCIQSKKARDFRPMGFFVPGFSLGNQR